VWRHWQAARPSLPKHRAIACLQRRLGATRWQIRALMREIEPDRGPCVVYIFVEPERFKIGRTVNIDERARSVTPNVIWGRSTVIFFDRLKDAINCERMLLWLFRSSRLPSLLRDGGTEFFSLDCLPSVENFIREHKAAIAFLDIKHGHELLS
jgi:hypothetical protein